MKANTDDIRRAIGRLLDDRGWTMKRLAAELGVSQHSTVVRWRSGQTKGIRPAVWAKLNPLLAPYLADRRGTGGNIAADKSADPYLPAMLDLWGRLDPKRKIEALKTLNELAGES